MSVTSFTDLLTLRTDTNELVLSGNTVGSNIRTTSQNGSENPLLVPSLIPARYFSVLQSVRPSVILSVRKGGLQLKDICKI